jgi:hypothetical protein
MARAKDATAKSGGTALSGRALEDALARGSFDQPKPQLIGMVKASLKSGYISFAQTGCESWVDVPSSLIAEAQQIGHQSCKDHSHPLFRLVLSEPTDPEVKALIGLLTARTHAPFMPLVTPANLGGVAAGPPAPFMPMVSPANLGGVAAAGSVNNLVRKPQCDTWCSGSTLVCGCPVYVPGLGMAYVIYPCGTCINDPVFTAFA